MCTSLRHTCMDIRQLTGGRWWLNLAPLLQALLGTEHQRCGGPSCFPQSTINIRSSGRKSFIKQNVAGESSARSEETSRWGSYPGLWRPQISLPV